MRDRCAQRFAAWGGAVKGQKMTELVLVPWPTLASGL